MKLILPTLILLLIKPAYADEALKAHIKEYRTDVDCENVHSTIVSSCSMKYGIHCSKHVWHIEEKEINLDADGFHPSEWACLTGKDGQKIIFYGGNDGNCEQCEKISIWGTKAETSTKWLSIDPAYRDGGFPQVRGQAFWQQFHYINIGQEDYKKLKHSN